MEYSFCKSSSLIQLPFVRLCLTNGSFSITRGTAKEKEEGGGGVEEWEEVKRSFVGHSLTLLQAGHLP